MALLLVSPYLIYAEWHQNLVDYVVASIKFGERDAGRTGLHELPRFSADLSQPLMSETGPTPAQPPRINVRWAAGTDDATRAARERALGLLPDNPLAADAWRYSVQDWSAPRLAAIVTDPLVVATDGIDRSHMALERQQGPRLGRVLSAINRTQLLPGLITEQNAIAFLYYAIVISPLVTLGLILWRPLLAGVRPWNRASAKMMVVAVLALVMIDGLVRSNVGARLVDMSEVSGVIMAWLAGLLLARSTRRGRVAAVSVAILFLLVTAVSVQAIEQVTLQLAGTGFDTGRQGMLRHARDVHRVLSAVPPVAAWDRSEPGIVELASYINRCTQPSDRVVVLGYMPELYFLSQRGFGAGSAWILPGFFDSEADQRLMIARIESHRVPIVLTAPDPEYTEDYVAGFPVLHQFLARDYQEAGEVDSDPHYRMRVLVRRSHLRGNGMIRWSTFHASPTDLQWRSGDASGGFAAMNQGLTNLGARVVRRLLSAHKPLVRIARRRARNAEQSGFRREALAVEREIAEVASGAAPIIAGPWLAEVGYEVLYWIPFLRWFTDKHGILPSRLIVVSRGGVRHWYADLAATYVDMFDHMSPEHLGARNMTRQTREEGGGQKQTAAGALDQEILGVVRARLGVREAKVCHPSLLFRLFRHVWYGNLPLDFFWTRTRYERIPETPRIPILSRVSRRLLRRPSSYSGTALPLTDANQAFVRALVGRVALTMPIVSLESDFGVDEHRDFDVAGIPNVLSARQWMTAATNLGCRASWSRARHFSWGPAAGLRGRRRFSASRLRRSTPTISCWAPT